MSSNGLMVTVVGWAASTPREVVGDGVPFTSFRVATTPRYFDNRQGAWTDGRTEWITVKAFRDVAFNVASSIHKGEPVLAYGRLRTEDWVGENGPRTGLVLEATAIGHDLTRGSAKFARTVYTTGPRDAEVGPGPAEESGAAQPDGDAQGTGLDLTDPWATPAGGVVGDEVAALDKEVLLATP
ncbi:single-stranded DNA-binding protein [Cellulomonas sp. KRMCY2]|uniref:single-stranded DNA-binding protein n=1 Tax=Cellulomonas sp. KRMCY2 TaxID=1304865 RepID=UPI00045EA45B|nr:single-stranded DNA-binding protein [Cellulomonas sp. KRMCY2]